MIIYVCLFIIILIISVIIYAYNTGSCQLDKKYICNKDFCLYKTFKFNIPENLKKSIDHILPMENLQTRVSISMYPENILNCALPNRNGITISTKNIQNHCNDLIAFYQNDLKNYISNLINLQVHPTNLLFPTSCAILIYNKEDDWINWHYDYNYYNGRFFTVLIPITHVSTCTKFQFKNAENKVTSLDLTNEGICFEGNFLYHRASKLCKDEKRVILSCQYVTDNTMSSINQLRIKLKDYAFIGKLF
jgi:hypothetical protein